MQTLARALLQPQAAAGRPQRSKALHNVIESSATRRALLASFAAAAGSLLLPIGNAQALALRSLQSQVPSVITFRNELDTPVKVYWVSTDACDCRGAYQLSAASSAPLAT